MNTRWSRGVKCLAVILSLLLVMPGGMVSFAQAAENQTKVVHKPLRGDYIPGFRIVVDAQIEDPAGLITARCYFKSKNDANFAFVEMTSADAAAYQATLPAPFVNSEEVQYLFVAVNNNKQVTRTQLFTLSEAETEEGTAWQDINEVKEVRVDRVQEAAERYVALFGKNKGKYADRLASYQTASSEGTIQVGTEVNRNLAQVQGFYDTATVSQVPGAARYGLLAENLYSAEAVAAGGGSSAAGGATAAGMTVATTGGLSTAALIGIGAGVVAVGGVAAASGGGGGGSSSSDGDTGGDTGGDTDAITTENLIGTSWSVSGIRADGQPRTGTVLFDSGGLFDYNFADYGGAGFSTWSLSGSTLTMQFPSVWTGPISGNMSSFTFNNAHGSYTFTRQ